ncbi:40S ribosomal protein S27-RELATED [Anaeramoeba ignava]|uniref:40S ribosomal protein S27-RELATED n=1 Tax=Anaeramoeba ignava TaxID=1746090 RepID=A0A9Q0R4Y0_ANAIG|nr:40S ribosomal protein S27-RELATED [Anaeramoeba ignava]
MVLEKDLLNPKRKDEKQKHKKKRLIPTPNSYFLDVKCHCGEVSTLFSHSNTVVKCPSCNRVLCTPSAGKAKITPGLQARKKLN